MARCRDAAAEDEPLRVEVYTRSAVPEYGVREYYDRVTAKIDEFVQRGTLTDCRIETWGKQLRVEDGFDEGAGGRAETVSELRSWARAAGVRLPFQVRQCRSSIINDSYAVLVPPHVLVAVYGEDGLYGIAPCSDGERSVSVLEFLDRLDGNVEHDETMAPASP